MSTQSQRCVEAARERSVRTLVITKPAVFLVEGMDEICFFCALLEHLGFEDKAQVVSYNGKSQLKDKLGALLRQTAFINNVASIGITQDADQNHAGAFQSVCDVLQYHRLSVPTQNLQKVTGKPDVTVLIIPPTQSGMMEDLCLQSISGSKELSCVDSYLNCLAVAGSPLPSNVTKAKVHSYLAGRTEPGKRLGEAALANYWNLDHVAFQDIRNFMNLVVP